MALLPHPETRHDTRISALDALKGLQSLTFSMGEVQVQEFNWDRPTFDVWTSDGYFLNLTVKQRRNAAHATYLEADGPIAETVGRLMFVPPGMTLRSGGGSGVQRTLSCMLKPEAVERLLERKPQWDKGSLTEGLHLNSPEIEWFLLKMYDELQRPGFAHEAMIESLASGLAVALVRTFNLNEVESRTSRGGLAPWRMKLIRERVAAERPLPSLAELADLCGLSVRHLTRTFRAEADLPISRYIEKAMADRARAMLEDTVMPIGEIAAALGFANSSSFAFAFRRATGLRPNDVRRLAQMDQA